MSRAVDVHGIGSRFRVVMEREFVAGYRYLIAAMFTGHGTNKRNAGGCTGYDACPIVGGTGRTVRAASRIPVAVPPSSSVPSFVHDVDDPYRIVVVFVDVNDVV